MHCIRTSTCDYGRQPNHALGIPRVLLGRNGVGDCRETSGVLASFVVGHLILDFGLDLAKERA